MTADAMYKPGYEGDRLSSNLSQQEKQALRLGKAALVGRLYDAMLTMSVMDGGGLRGLAAGGTPAHLIEFSDRVGQDKPEPPRHIFKPTAAQVSDMDAALALLEGLRPAYFKVVMLRAFHNFERRCGESGSWTWDAIGGYLGMSARWAEQAHDAAVVQAARRSGLLPRATTDHALFVAGVWADRAWMSNIGTAADPRQAIANLRVKSPLRIESGFAIWVAGPPMAKRVFDDVRKQLRSLNSHAAWFKANPDTICDEIIARAREINASWMIEDIQVKGPSSILAA